MKELEARIFAQEKHKGQLDDNGSVFSSHKPTIEMFRKRGIFVFDCNQGE